MSLVHVSGYAHVNPVDVAKVEGFPLTLSIVVTMRNGDALTRYVDEKDIAELMEPSTDDPATWSERQFNLWLTIHHPSMGDYTSEAGRRYQMYTNKGRRMTVFDWELEAVNDHKPCVDRESAFALKLSSYVALFNRAS